MAPVFDNSAEWITEHGDRFVEGDAMLDTILACLMDVPFEPRATFHLAWRFISSRAVKQCPKIQTVASARSTKRHSALISRICSIVRARDSSSSGLATTTARHIARDTATLRRLREKRNWSARGSPRRSTSPSSRRRSAPPGPTTLRVRPAALLRGRVSSQATCWVNPGTRCDGAHTRPRVAGVERLLHIPRRGNRVPLDVAALSYSDELLLLLGLVVEDQTVPYAPPLGRRLRGASGEHERDEQREEQPPSTLHTTRSDLLADARRGCQCSFDFRSRLAGQVARQLFTRSRFILCMTRFTYSRVSREGGALRLFSTAPSPAL